MIPAERLDAFAKWLARQGYAPTTIRKFRSDVATMAQWGPEPPRSERARARISDYRLAWGRWAECCRALGWRNTLVEPQLPARRVGGRRQKRLRPALSFEPKAWEKLRKRVRAADDTPSRVIDVLVSTGKRVSDVLGVDEPTLRAAFGREDGTGVITVKGSKEVVFSVQAAPVAWQRLLDALEPGQQVCDAVSPGSSTMAGEAAYQRVNRALKAHAAAVGLDPKLARLHGTRRTVATSLARSGASLEEVQRVLDHESRRTTERYLDEGLSDIATRALRRLNKLESRKN